MFNLFNNKEKEFEEKLQQHKEKLHLIKLSGKKIVNDLRLELNSIIEQLEKNNYVFELNLTTCEYTHIIHMEISRGKYKEEKDICLTYDFEIHPFYNYNTLIKYPKITYNELIIIYIDDCITLIKNEEKKQEERIKLLNGRTEQQYKIDCLMEKINREE